MTIHPLCSEELVNLGAIDLLFRIILKSQVHGTKQVLLKVLRNLSRWTKQLQLRLSEALQTQQMDCLIGVTTDPTTCVQTAKEDETYDNERHVSYTSLYWEKHIWDTHVVAILQGALCCENEDLLVEWVGILSNLTSDDLPAGYHLCDLLDEHHSGIVDLFNKILSCSGDLKIELIIWIGELCNSKECSFWMASNSIVDVVQKSFAEEQKDNESRLQILLTLEKLLMYEDTRYQIIIDDGELPFDAMPILF